MKIGSFDSAQLIRKQAPHGLPSLPEVFRSVQLPKGAGFFRKLFAFAGPAYLVSVGYMDPGNWATDIEGGARFGYQLIWVLLLSNAIAVLLQTLCARLGLATQKDLAQACRDWYPKWMSIPLWLLCEVAIVACDLAEVLGGAIGLNLLFHIPLLYAVLIMAGDVFILLLVQGLGFRWLESFIVVLVGTIMACFGYEIFLAKPDWVALGSAAVHPTITRDSLYVALGILGATVMPHNLYLHSAIVQTRAVVRTPKGIKEAAKFNFIDSLLALNLAFFVNAAILVMSAAVFHSRGVAVKEMSQAHELLTPMLGTALASALFAVALICSGQASTFTGTLAGQIVMEGFLHIRIRPWLRRLITRLLAIGPAAAMVLWKGEEGSYQLLILSQVILSLQLPFAVVPLIMFTSNKARMGQLVSPWWVQALAWPAAALIIALNCWLLLQAFGIA